MWFPDVPVVSTGHGVHLTMKSRYLVVFAAAITCIVAIGLWSLAGPGESGHESVQARSPRTEVHAPSDHGSPVPASSVAPYTRFARAKDAAAALAALSALDSGHGHDAVDARIYLSSVCRDAAAGRHVAGSDAWLEERLASFCGSYADLEVMGMTPAELMDFQERGTRAQIESILGEEGIQRRDASRILEDVVLLSDSPWEVQAALAIASERDYVLDVYREALPGSDATAARDVLALVAELQYCALAGGCGSGTLAALRGCLFTGLCGPTVDYISQLRHVYPPAVFADAMAVHEAIMRSRAAGG